MRIWDMSDAQLRNERRKMACVPGKYAAKRFLAVLAEETKREKAMSDEELLRELMG